MTQEHIEGNKIIAEFDGWKFSHFVFKDTEDELTYYKKYDSDGNCIHDGILHIPEYNENWNILMEVVEKIESLGKSVRIENYSVWVTYSHNQNPREERLYIYKHEKTKIEAVWLSVIGFIKFYNQNKQQ